MAVRAKNACKWLDLTPKVDATRRRVECRKVREKMRASYILQSAIIPEECDSSFCNECIIHYKYIIHDDKKETHNVKTLKKL